MELHQARQAPLHRRVLLLSRERVPAADLARRYEVSARTIYRDLEAINEAGIPVVSFPGPGGGFGIDPSYTIDRRLLSFDDLRSMIAALKGVNSAIEDRALGSALEKIASLAPRSRAPELLEDRIVIDLFPWGGGRMSAGSSSCSSPPSPRGGSRVSLTRPTVPLEKSARSSR